MIHRARSTSDGERSWQNASVTLDASMRLTRATSATSSGNSRSSRSVGMIGALAHTHETTAAGGAGVVWRCSGCPQVLGIVEGRSVTIKHAGRQIKATLPCAQVCDGCKTLNWWPSATDTAADVCTPAPHAQQSPG
jgi:hypothetical protein